jgi:hypothetical protein
MAATFKVEVELPDRVTNPARIAGALAVAFGEALVAEPTAGLAKLEIEEEPAADGAADGEDESDAESPYTGEGGADALQDLLGEIAESTRRAVRLIAEASVDAGQIHGVELREQLGIGSPSELAGILTSLGFAEKRTGLPKPYEQWWGDHDGVSGYVYAMDGEIARAILDLTDEQGNIVKPA